MKILLVDDDLALCSILKMELEDNDHKVDLAHDSTLGKKKAFENKYDFIILDIILPGINGFELCKKIRNVVKAPILMLTSLGLIEDRVKGFNCGADGYLSKPFNFHELHNRITELHKWHQLAE